MVPPWGLDISINIMSFGVLPDDLMLLPKMKTDETEYVAGEPYLFYER